jgi:outer membrane lipoprotein-sorting protein
MKSVLLILLVGLFLRPALSWAEDADAKALVNRILEAQHTRGFVIRAKLTVSETGSDSHKAAQLRIKSRRDETGARWVYQVLWPAAEKGTALYLERLGKKNLGGFFFTPPDKVEAIGNDPLGMAYLNSDLSLEDLVDDFWQWPDPKAGAQEQAGRETCRIVNLRPPPDVKSNYSLIRAWISEEKAVPMRLLKFNRQGQAAKEFLIQKIVQNQKFWFPMVTIIQKPGGTRQTLFEISRGDRDVEVPLSDFSLEEIKKAAAAN